MLTYIKKSSPYINRFLQPDTIIPDPSNPQSWNRYSYGLNNPSRYTDPTGHAAIGDTNEAGCSGKGPACIINMYAGYGDDQGMDRSLEAFAKRHRDYDPIADPELDRMGAVLVAAAFSRVGCDGGSTWDCVALGAITGFGSPIPAGGGGFLTPLNNSVPANLFNDVYSSGGWVNSFPSEYGTNFAGAASPTIYGPSRQLYRLHSGNAEGGWWTTVPPKSEIQFRIDYAHRPDWGKVDSVSTLTVPDKSFTQGWEGATSYQGDFYVGGATQVYLPYVNPQWITTVPFP